MDFHGYFSRDSRWWRKWLVLGMLLGLLGLEIASLPWCALVPADRLGYMTVPAENIIITATATAPVLRISDIDGPRIDDEAAAVVVEEPEPVMLPAPRLLPTSVWIFLFFAYAILLAFNLIVGYWQSAGLGIQWRWELIQTALFLIGWTVWDGYLAAPWFPFVLLKAGLILYVAYLAWPDRARSRGM